MSLKEIFFELGNDSFAFFLLRTMALLAIVAVFIWIINLLLPLFFKKRRLKSDFLIPVYFQYSLIVFSIILTVFFGIVIWYNGVESFKWTEASFYLSIAHIIILFLLLILVFFVSQRKYRNIIK